MRSIDVELPGGRVAFSTRDGGVSEGPYESLNLGVKTGDAEERVAENRRRLCEHLGLEQERVARLWQVHAAELREWREPPGPPGWAELGRSLDHADGHLTTVPGVGLSVLVADCLPVALVAPGRAAMLHCGWRPLAAGIVERALERFDEPPAAAIGPGIGGCCYEVGEEVHAHFTAHDARRGERGLDLAAVARARLDADVHDTGVCTMCRPDLFFSHRRAGGITGRQAGVVWRG